MSAVWHPDLTDQVTRSFAKIIKILNFTTFSHLVIRFLGLCHGHFTAELKYSLFLSQQEIYMLWNW